MKITKKVSVPRMIKIAKDLSKKTGHSCNVEIVAWKYDHLEKPKAEYQIVLVPTGNADCIFTTVKTWKELQEYYLKVMEKGL